MSQQSTTAAQNAATTSTSDSTEPEGVAGTTATFDLLLRLLNFTNGDIDQAEKLAQLIARLSPGSPSSLLLPSPAGNGHGHGHSGCGCGGPSTKTSVGANTAAAAAASTTGVAVATSVPNSSATATAVAPSLLTVGSTTSTTAVPFSEASAIPTGVTLNIGVTGAVSYEGATGTTGNTQQASATATNQAIESQPQQQLKAQMSMPIVRFQATPAQESSHPQQPPPLNTSNVNKDFPWQPQPHSSSQHPTQHQTDEEAEAETIDELRHSPIHRARIVNIRRSSSGGVTPTGEPSYQRYPPPKPLNAANMAKQRPLSLGPSDPRMDRYLAAESQREFEKYVPYQEEAQPPQIPPRRGMRRQESSSSQVEELEAQNEELKDEIARLTQQCRAWERIASLSVSLASVEGDSKRASLVSTTTTFTEPNFGMRV